MNKQESLQDKFSKIFNNVKHIPNKLANAVEEGIKEGLQESSDLVCVQEGVLDFELIEEDVKWIEKDLKAKGDKVLGSHLILDDERNLMEIKTYTERGNKTFVTTVDAEVKRVTNIPSDILKELKEQGRVELSLK